MELELVFPRWTIGWGLLALLGLIGIGALGRTLTPAGERLLTPTEWRVSKAESAYRKELNTLRRDLETLVELLNRPPEPVRAQLATERILRDTHEGQPSLAYPREALAEAALAVRDWAVGAVERQQAEQSLNAAIQALEGHRHE